MAGPRRKTTSSGGGSAAKRSRTSNTLDLGWKGGDDEIDSEDDDDMQNNNNNNNQDDSDSEEEETVEAKKVRLAREYLQKIERNSDESSSDDDDDNHGIDEGSDGEEIDRVGLKLQKQRLKRDGTYERAIADKLCKRINAIKLDIVDKRTALEKASKETASRASLTPTQLAKEWVTHDHVTMLKGHDLTTTCVSLQADGSRAVSGSKDHSVILWDIETSTNLVNLWEHWRKRGDADNRTGGQVLSVACSDDGRYAAVGRQDATVSIFDIRQAKSNLVKTFTGHKSGITSLAFQTQSLQLFSGSEDRCIRHYTLEEMMYLETLYGHQFGVTGIDCHRKERPISVGRDRTARAWKLSEDTHLIFRGGAKLSPADCVSIVKDDWFLTGHENGQLCLWMTEKKKAAATVDFAHGTLNENDESIGNSVGSIDTLKGSDLACTGSNDGFLRLWKVKTGASLAERGLEPLSQIPINGFINDIAIGPKAKFCVVAVGQEPRLGRWSRVPKAQNRLGIVKLDFECEGGDDSGSEEEGVGGDDQSAGEDDDEPARVDSGSDGEE